MVELSEEQLQYRDQWLAAKAMGEKLAAQVKAMEAARDEIMTTATPAVAPSAKQNPPAKVLPGSKEHQAIRAEFLDRYSAPPPLPKVGGLPNAVELGAKPGSPEHAALKRAYLEKYV